MSFVCDVTVLNSSAVHHCRGTERQETQQNDSWQTLAVSVTDVRSHSAKWLLAVYTLHRRRRGRSSCWPSGMRLLSIVMYTRHVVTSNPFMLLGSSAERLRRPIVQPDGIRRRRHAVDLRHARSVYSVEAAFVQVDWTLHSSFVQCTRERGEVVREAATCQQSADVSSCRQFVDKLTDRRTA